MSALGSVARVPSESCHMHARAGSFSRTRVPPLAQLLGAKIARYLQMPSELTTDGVPVTRPFEKATDRSITPGHVPIVDNCADDMVVNLTAGA